jgi:chromosomal replication initiator protein
MDAVTLWNRACGQLKTVLNEDTYSRWIDILKPVGFETDILTLGVENDFHQMWITENYLPLIRQAMKFADPEKSIEVKFSIQSSDPAPLPVPPPARPAGRAKKTKADLARKSQSIGVMNPKYTFDEFVIGPSNSFAHAAALAVAQSPGRAYNPLFIYGQTGLGKTHLIQAVGNRVMETPGMTVAYVSSEALLNEYVTALQNRSTVDFRTKYRNVDVMLIDDIHFLAGKASLQEEFFHTFNALFESRKQIIMTSDRPASEISGLEKRLVSRFEWGLVTELECPDFETRLAILRYKQAHLEKPLASELQTFIAENVQSNVRALEGAMVRAISYSSLTSEPLTLDSLRYLLRDLLDKERQEDLTFDDIHKAVADFFDVRVTDLSSKRRPRSVAMPRQIAMYLCRRLTRASLPEIADSFGKTHGTVLHACKAIQNRMSVDDTLRQNIRTCVRKLGHDPVALQI